MLVRPASGKKVLWQEMLRHELLSALEQNAVVIVPVGSVEQHGPHCPQDVDISGPYHMAIATADAIDDFPVIVAPPVLYGFTHYNMGEIGTLTLSSLSYSKNCSARSAARSGRTASAGSFCSMGTAATRLRRGTPRSNSLRRISGHWRSPTGTWPQTNC